MHSAAAAPFVSSVSPERASSIRGSFASAKHIVILDDDENVLRSVERLVIAAGFRVTATTSPKIAMEVVVCDGADAIISDLHMPEMGGQIVLAMLATAAPHCARVLLTSDTDFARVASLAVPYSVHAFVSKRDTITRLIPALKELFLNRPEGEHATSPEEVRGLARSIVRALALRDYETELHCERVSAWSRRLASAVNLSPSRVLDVELGALLHDVGKIGVRDAVLLKPGPLDEGEWNEMRRHPELGVALLADVPSLKRAIPIVQCHHERRDGKGYPRALSGDDIPIDARIFQVVDAYDAIVSDRPYRKGREDAVARAEIQKHVGPQFDPEVFEAFQNIEAEEWTQVCEKLR